MRRALAGLTTRGRSFVAAGATAIVCAFVLGERDLLRAGILVLVLPLLSTLAVFGAGYVARPLGAIFFGWLGDRHGRRVALLSTVTGMGLATCLLGVIPTYSQVGVLAPLLLMLIRLVQGFSAGGELIGAVTYVAESAPRERWAVARA